MSVERVCSKRPGTANPHPILEPVFVVKGGLQQYFVVICYLYTRKQPDICF